MTITNNFQQIVDQHKDKVALISEYEGQITYEELNHYANYVAHKICEQIGGTNPVIGICIHRSFKMIATMLGTLKAGAAYIPIDPSYPKDRITYCLNKSDVDYILCDSNSESVISEEIQKIIIEDFASVQELNIAEYTFEDDNALAYIQYTSGSTGDSRGVMVTHKSIMNTLEWRIEYYQLDHKDINVQIPSYAFASSVEDIYSTLLSGGTLIMIKAKDLLNLKYLKHLITTYHVTHFIMVPSLYREFVTHLKNNDSLRFITIAGEQYDQNLVSKHYDMLLHTILYNEYGMTETSVGCLAMRIDRESKPNIIGELIPNMGARIMNFDEDGIGELYVSGIGLAVGYHKDEEGTNQKFVIVDHERYFMTGDYVKRNEDGYYIHMGRKDKQIKVSGQRVNLSEIDNVLNLLDDVVHAVSTIVKIRDSEKILTFIQSKNTDVEYYQKYLSSKLPGYYMPNFIQIVDEFEYLPNRKINIRKMGVDYMEQYNEELLRNNSVVIKLIELLKGCSDKILSTIDLNIDVRKVGLTSIHYIQFVAKVEEAFEFEFGYDDLDQIKPLSIVALYQYINDLDR